MSDAYFSLRVRHTSLDDERDNVLLAFTRQHNTSPEICLREEPTAVPRLNDVETLMMEGALNLM